MRLGTTCQFGSSAGCIYSLSVKHYYCRAYVDVFAHAVRVFFLLVVSGQLSYPAHMLLIDGGVFQLNGIEKTCRLTLAISSLIIHFQRVFQLV